MEWMEVVSLWVLLILALYGCFCGLYQSACVILRPREPCMTLTVSIDDNADVVEQRLRYAQALSKRWGVSLIVTGDCANAEAYTIAQKLLSEYGLDFPNDETENSCIVNTSCV